MSNYRELLIGCGARRIKDIDPRGKPAWENLTTLDMNGDHNPDVLWNLEDLPLPFEDSYFEEIHAYEVLEHCGRQGDYQLFFAQFSDFWRILTPNGLLCATVPLENSVWTWGDPGHTRVINKGTLTFLCQEAYQQIGTTTMSDYRNIYSADFKVILLQEVKSSNTLRFVLEAIK